MLQTSRLLTLLLLTLLSAREHIRPCQAAARLIRVHLERVTTQGAGEFGQPVISYLTPVKIGTPPKKFNIQFDVGSNELFVPHYSWNPFNRNLHYGDGFQCKVSSSCHKDDRSTTIEYQHCKLTGKRYEDLMILANAQLAGNETVQPFLWRQNFLAISSASDSRFQSLPVDGFFGLGPAAQSQDSSVGNVLIALHKADQIDNLQFSIWLNPVLDSSLGGELVLGGIDLMRYKGQIYWHHLQSGLGSDQWALGLQYVSLGNQIVSCSDGRQCQARLSTGKSDLYGPHEDVQRIYHLLNTSPQSNGLQLIDCRRINNLPVLTLNIDGIPYAMLPSNYIRKTIDGLIFKTETCYVAIMPSREPELQRSWLLGTNFLGAYYSTFDVTYRQVGFAALR